jgi:hypothetical protein
MSCNNIFFRFTFENTTGLRQEKSSEMPGTGKIRRYLHVPESECLLKFYTLAIPFASVQIWL